MNCETFQSHEIDALYDELDADTSAAMTEHAASCSTCAARLTRLRSTRARVLAVAIEAVPTDFESRILAAVDAGLAKPAAPAVVALEERPSQTSPASPDVEGTKTASTGGGATILRFLSRPSFAMAATFVLVLGAAAFMLSKGASKAGAPMAAKQESAPGAVAEAEAEAEESDTVTASPVAMGTATAAAQAPMAPPPAAAASAPAESAREALAMNTPLPAPTTAGLAKAGPAARPTRSSADERALSSAKALADAGRCPEALPKLEALKASVPEAELYAARCIAKTRGCAAAAPRFDLAAQSNAGTEIGSRASIEGARCYQANGELAEARKRLVAAKDEGVLAAEASKELDALDRTGAPAAGGAPRGAVRAAPKAARPAAVEPAAPSSPTND